MADGTTDGTTNITYPQSLQQILGQPSQPGVFGYGFSRPDIQQLQNAGITPEQLMQMGLSTQPQTTTSAYQSGGQGPTTSPSAGGIQQSNNAALLQAMLRLGAGQQQQQQTGPPAPPSAYGKDYPLYATDAQGLLTGKPVAYAGAQNQASLLGAAALQSPLVINQAPSAALDPRSGVSKVGGALVGSNVPQVGTTWSQLAAQRPYLTPDTIAALQKSGLTANQAAGGVGVSVPLAGPWTTQPGLFTQAQKTAPTAAIPLQGAVQPTATSYNPVATPFAQPPPPAPGLEIPPFVAAAHTSGLADAGKAIFAHFGGDPNTASPAQIAAFHNLLTDQLTSAIPAFGSAYGTPPPITPPPWQGGQAGTGTAVAGQGGLPPANLIGTRPSGPIPPPNPMAAIGQPPQGNLPGISGGPPAFGSATVTPPLAAAPQPTAAKKMASGGVVPGRGNKDTVPALLTPGEYVIPKDQVAQFFGGRTPAKMAGGGFADPDPDPNAPPEARRKTLSAQTSSAAPAGQPSSSSAQSSTPPAAPGGSSAPSGLTSGLATAAHTYANSLKILNSGGASGGGYNTPGGYIGQSPGVGQSGYWYPSQAAAAKVGDVGVGPGGGMPGGAGSGQPTANALSGIASGLGQASQALAANANLRWQMQPNAIPAPPPAPAAPQFTQPQVAQQTQQGVNPYAAYAVNQARYPTSPYYT